jgi:cell wall-associated NlpC family hydrolase
MKIRLLSPAVAVLLAGALLGACSPKYNWRDYASPDAPYRVMFPAKPASASRTIELDGKQVSMTMTAADIDGATFAVGSAEAPDEAQARAALPAMMQALLRNIGVSDGQGKFHADASGKTVGEVDATGKANGTPVRLVGRFEARGKRFYQVIVLGKPDAMPPEQVEQFLTSFTLP